MNKSKIRVALSSVVAAFFLTIFKLIVGLSTGSLGILSEAIHSVIDFFAASITWYAVHASDKPADREHHFGHGKIENLSALIETILLLVVCVWIIAEALTRLTLGETQIDVTIWAYIVVVTSIVVDIFRARALKRAAKKYNSQALEADALHFSTDIWSSSVVLLGLICADFGYYFADSIAALGVAFIVIIVSLRLGKRAVSALLDTAPKGYVESVAKIISSINEIEHFHDLKVRTSGADFLVEVSIHVDSSLTIAQAHEISSKVEDAICKKIKRTIVHVHIEPDSYHKK